MKILLFSALLFFNFTIYSQNYCPGSFTPYYLNSNNVRASFFPRGNKFYGNQGGFQVPFPSVGNLKTINASSIWVGGFDDAQNLKLSAETFLTVTQLDFSVGPLNSIGLPYDTICSHYDRAWNVYYEDIQSHRMDFIEDFKLDDTIPSIFGWPGRGNKHFKKYYGFELPNDNQGLAPFFDWNGNNIYEPENGDYPCIYFGPGGNPVIPDQILWMVFNDLGPDDSTVSRPLNFEIQLTAFAFHCQDNEVLNNTIFNSYKIIDRAVFVLDSAFFGMWTDYDLGCQSDDFIGSDSIRSTEFVYNADQEDGDIGNDCFSGIPSYSGIPPVQSMTYLSEPMHSFIWYNNMQDDLPIQKYRLLNGVWPNGTPMRAEGDGHSTNSALPTTKFLFHGDPRDTSSWAENNIMDYGFDQRSVSSVSLGRMDPGDWKTIVIAYQYHHDPSGGQLDQITKMYKDVDSLKSLVGSINFDQHCTPFPICQEPDCIWPGDFDHNGIADHRDYLMWGVFKDLIGPQRDGLVSWRAQNGPDWNEVKAGINSKYGDADANGVINLGDISINHLNFLRTNKFYNKSPLYPTGPDIVLSSDAINAHVQVRNLKITSGRKLEHVLGLAFEIEFDTTQFYLLDFLPKWPDDTYILSYSDELPTNTFFKVAYVQTNHTELSIDSFYSFNIGLGNILQLKPELPVPDSTIIRLRNLIAVDKDGNDLYFGSYPLTIYRDGFTGTSHPTNMESHVSIYPNPANQSIFLETELSSDVLIFNLQGQEWKKIPASQIHEPIDITSLIPGFYFVKILKSGQTCKFIKL